MRADQEQIDKDIAARRERVHAYRLEIESAISQARATFAGKLAQDRETWTPERKAKLEGLLRPFDRERIYETVHAGLMQSMKEGGSCLLQSYDLDMCGEELALHAAHVAAGRVREAGHRTQVRRYGKAYVVKLLDV